MLSETKKQTILSRIGDAGALSRELQSFRRGVHVLSSSHPRLIEKYPKQWIAVQNGKVKVRARTFRSLMEQVDEQRLSREHIVVRFIDKNQRTLIL